ncbi:MFS transporter [Guyparkeria halophila]|uniref:MFS transporter n=1 Tax=Guyparkeria halophila TaxID=47960 RepID=A0ABZ0Z082_9GAMM|nr:MFS transporter [Guyparkeria halophila]WQH16790.1 MFS transporter [Guyparkeria halophila]
MLSTVFSVQSLLAGMGVLLAGSGLLATLLGLRAAEEGFSDGTIGLVMSAFYIGYVLGTLTIPAIIRRVGHIRTFAALAAISSAAAILHGLWVEPWFWMLLRLINGVTLLGLYMVIESWINEKVTTHRGQVFGIYMMVSLFAYGAGQFLIGIYGPMEVSTFAIVGLLFSLGLVPIALTRVSQPPPMETTRLPLLELFRLAPTGVIGAAMSGTITGTIYGMAAVYANRVGLPDTQVATFVAAIIVGGGLLQWPIGRLSDGRDRRYVLIVISTIGAAFSVLLALQEWFPGWSLFALALVFGGFSFSLYAISVAQTNDRLSSDQVLEGTRGLLMVNGAGSAVGPMVSGLAMGWFGAAGFPLFVLAALGTMILLIFWRILIDAPVPDDERGDYVFTHRTSAAGLELDPRATEEETETPPASEHVNDAAPPIYETDPAWEDYEGPPGAIDEPDRLNGSGNPGRPGGP